MHKIPDIVNKTLRILSPLVSEVANITVIRRCYSITIRTSHTIKGKLGKFNVCIIVEDCEIIGISIFRINSRCKADYTVNVNLQHRSVKENGDFVGRLHTPPCVAWLNVNVVKLS